MKKKTMQRQRANDQRNVKWTTKDQATRDETRRMDQRHSRTHTNTPTDTDTMWSYVMWADEKKTRRQKKKKQKKIKRIKNIQAQKFHKRKWDWNVRPVLLCASTFILFVKQQLNEKKNVENKKNGRKKMRWTNVRRVIWRKKEKRKKKRFLSCGRF